MPGFFYYVVTLAESVTSVFGIRAVYEQPKYVVLQTLAQDTEIRRYEPRVAIEATVSGSDREKAMREAFGLLFQYITGANQGSQMIAMTAPVRTQATPERIAMTAPVQTSGVGPVTMRFFLPRDVVRHGPPPPLDPRLHLVQVPETTIAALRYSGIENERTRAEEAGRLMDVLKISAWHPDGDVFSLNYDPPFTIPFLRRNEMAVDVSR